MSMQALPREAASVLSMHRKSREKPRGMPLATQKTREFAGEDQKSCPQNAGEGHKNAKSCPRTSGQGRKHAKSCPEPPVKTGAAFLCF